MTGASDRFGLLLIDPMTLRITWANDYPSALPGYDGRPIIGSPLTTMMPMSGELRIDESLRGVAETGVTHEETISAIGSPRQAGYTWWWEVHRLPSGELLVAFSLEGIGRPPAPEAGSGC